MDFSEDYDVLDRKEYWDARTREVVERRMAEVPRLAFFDDNEARTLEAAVARLLPQERSDAIPIVPFIDEKLISNQTDGTRYEGMPKMQELWKMFIRALDEEAESAFGKRFIDLAEDDRDATLNALAKGDTSSLTWRKLPAERAFTHVVTVAASFYYAHPRAWSEIGWGGPKYPERYVRIRCGVKDSEEAGDVGNIRE